MDRLYSLDIKFLFRSFREEGWSFIFISSYLFFEYVRPQTIYPQIDVIPWVQIIIILTLITALVKGEFGRSVRNINNKLIVIYGIVVLLSSATSEFPAVSFMKLRTFFDWFLIYFLITKIVNNERRFIIFFISFLFYSFKMSQHGFLSWVQRGFAFENWGVTGAPGWFQNSGEVGIQMCIFVPLAIAFISGEKKNVSNVWLVFLLLMPLTGLGTAIGSSSRGALVGLGAAGLWFILGRNLKQFILYGIIVSLVATVVYFSIPEESLQRFRSSGSDNTSKVRIERWNHGIEAMNQFPILGVGFEAWSEYYPKHFDIKEEGTLLVHNIFVQCGSELGYAGLTVFVLMILTCFYNTRQVHKLSMEQDDQFFSHLSFGFNSALVGFLASGFFVTVLYYPYFWIHCALTNCLRTAAEKKFKVEKL